MMTALWRLVAVAVTRRPRSSRGTTMARAGLSTDYIRSLRNTAVQLLLAVCTCLLCHLAGTQVVWRVVTEGAQSLLYTVDNRGRRMVSCCNCSCGAVS
eukprot:17395-Heterococcus_DN1.PRE.2